MTTINKIVKIIYYLILTIIVIFVLVSVCSYLNVYLRYGEVPYSNDYTQKFIDSGKEFNIFPEKEGFIIIFAYLYSILISVCLIPSIFILNRFNNKINTHKKLAIVIILAQVFVMIQANFFNYMSWYSGYVLD